MSQTHPIDAPLDPGTWPMWLIFGLFRLAVLLPLPPQKTLGRGIGRLFRLLGRRRARIVRINIDLCFPKLSPHQRNDLVRAHFEAFGIGLLELAFGWWASSQRVQTLVELHGIEHLRQAYAQSRGVILLSAHFTTLEIGGRFLAEAAPDLPLKAFYRPSDNPVLEYLMRKNRHARFGEPIPRDDMRGLLRALRHGEIIWYASDQNFGHKGGVFAPFFDIPAATNTVTSRLAAGGAIVVPFFTYRLPNGRYMQIIEPALDHFPSGDPVTDATRINALITKWVHRAPEQYFWAHRRFKDRPGDEPRFY